MMAWGERQTTATVQARLVGDWSKAGWVREPQLRLASGFSAVECRDAAHDTGFLTLNPLLYICHTKRLCGLEETHFLCRPLEGRAPKAGSSGSQHQETSPHYFGAQESPRIAPGLMYRTDQFLCFL